MAEHLTSKKRTEMRELYLEHRSVEAVARLGNVAWRTAEKYRVEDDWDRAAERVDRLAEDHAVKRIGKRRADNIRIAQAGIVKMARGLEGCGDSIPFNAHAVDRLARLVEFLSGEPDSRPDVSAEGAVRIYIPDNGRASQVNTPPETAPATSAVETTPVK